MDQQWTSNVESKTLLRRRVVELCAWLVFASSRNTGMYKAIVTAGEYRASTSWKTLRTLDRTMGLCGRAAGGCDGEATSARVQTTVDAVDGWMESNYNNIRVG